MVATETTLSNLQKYRKGYGFMGFGPENFGGSSSIGSGTDVALSNPADTEVLTYDGSIGKWKNAPPASSSSTPDATTSTKGKLQLAGDLGGTADTPTVPGLANKVSTTQLGQPNGVARLDSDGDVVNASGAKVLSGILSIPHNPDPATLAGLNTGDLYTTS